MEIVLVSVIVVLVGVILYQSHQRTREANQILKTYRDAWSRITSPVSTGEDLDSPHTRPSPPMMPDAVLQSPRFQEWMSRQDDGRAIATGQETDSSDLGIGK